MVYQSQNTYQDLYLPVSFTTITTRSQKIVNYFPLPKAVKEETDLQTEAVQLPPFMTFNLGNENIS